MSHTSGPWVTTTTLETHQEFKQGLIFDQSNRRIASVHVLPGHETSWDYEREANARLIAASPRLLDALKGLVGLIQLLPDEVQRGGLQKNNRYVEALEALAEASESERA